MGALSGKIVLLVTHQVDFLPTFDYVMFMSDGEILSAGPYHELLASSKDFRSLVDAHRETIGFEFKTISGKSSKRSGGNRLIKQEEREVGDTGFKPCVQYLNKNKGYLFFTLAAFLHASLMIGQISQNS